MQKKNILVTGASQGIGRAVANKLLLQGENVILVARQKEKLLELQTEFPNQTFIYPFDLHNIDCIENIFLFCKQNGLRLNGMVHAAGISEDCPVKNVDLSLMVNTMEINFYSFVQLGKYFSLKKYSYEGSSVVAMSSMASFFCEKGMSQYAASKAALNAFVKVMSKEVIKRSIRVNAIAPGFVDTEMTWAMKDVVEDFEENIRKRQPLGVIPVDQIVNLTEFLLSDKSAYITGTIIPVSGGTL